MIEEIRQRTRMSAESPEPKKTGSMFRSPLMTRTLEMTKERAMILAEKSTLAIISFLSSILTLILVLAVAVFLYATFYYAYMPADMFRVPVNLEFEPCHNRSSSQRCSDLIGKVFLGRGRKLLQGQTYKINMKMTVPDNEVNEMEGMFMMCLSVFSASGVVVDKSCRSSMTQYRSYLLRLLETITFSPSLLLGFSAQKQELEVNFFNDFQTDPHSPTELLTLEIQSRQLQVFEVHMEVLAEMKGVRQLMYRHPWLSAIFGISSNIIILMMIIAVSWSRFLTQESWSGDNDEEDVMEDEDGKDSLHDDSIQHDDARERMDEERQRQYLGSHTNRENTTQSRRSSLGWSMLVAMINMCVLTSMAYLCFTAYQNDIYEPSKLMEIVKNDLESLVLISNLLSWDDIFIKLFVVKIVTVIMLMIIMNTARFIE